MFASVLFDFALRERLVKKTDTNISRLFNRYTGLLRHKNVKNFVGFLEYGKL
jgi:hypothetical protein